VSGARKIYDWTAIRAFYEAGHTASECQREFDISNGAWHGAVRREAVVLRAGGRRAPRTDTRKAVAELLDQGYTQAEVARRLGVSRPTVCFHARRLGVRPTASARRYDWVKVQAFYDLGFSAAECRERFGFSRYTWADAIRRGAIRARPRLEPLEDVLAAGRPRSRQHVKSRLMLAQLKPPFCEGCGLEEWQGRPISLELHHINGDGYDNRLENLQLLCPNCHSQTDTWGGRNKGPGRM
jgi:hypothetical protein